MPGKNKPKRLDRNRAWRVARRKKKRSLLVKGNSRNRQPRPKNKGVIAARNSVPSKKGTDVPASSGKVVEKVRKVVKKEDKE